MNLLAKQRRAISRTTRAIRQGGLQLIEVRGEFMTGNEAVSSSAVGLLMAHQLLSLVEDNVKRRVYRLTESGVAFQ